MVAVCGGGSVAALCGGGSVVVVCGGGSVVEEGCSGGGVVEEGGCSGSGVMDRRLTHSGGQKLTASAKLYPWLKPAW